MKTRQPAQSGSLHPICSADTRYDDVCRIESAYEDAEAALREVGRLLRTTYAGKFMWASDHKIAVSGIRVALESMRRRLPQYEKPNTKLSGSEGGKD